MSQIRLHVLVAIAACAATIVVSASCGPTVGDCTPSTCTGCCDENGECQPGFLDSACGLNGSACASCTAPSLCGTGVCVLPGNGDGGTCKSSGVSCSFDGECCSGSCSGSMCAATDAGACSPNGTACFAHSDCCSQDCVNGLCQGEPPGDGGTPGCGDMSGDRKAQVCARWNCERATRDEGLWSGSLSECMAGDNPVNRVNAVRMVNLYRFLADLPEVTDEATRNAKAQQCALMMHANNALSHTPPSTWTCYTSDGATAAGSSNIATAPGVFAVDLYMVDSGANNAGTLGHRRWILDPNLGPIGSGSTSNFSCLWVIGGMGTATRDFVAWPPPGPFPIAAYAPAGAGSLGTTGWSIQSDTINLSGVIVSVTDNGSPMPVTTSVLGQGYGSMYAIKFVPQGWAPQAGHTYDVTLTGLIAPITYSVEFVDCP